MISGPSVDDCAGEKSNSEMKHGLLLAAACWHRDQNLRRKGMMALALNVMETRRLKFHAQNHFQTNLMMKYFSKVTEIKILSLQCMYVRVCFPHR